MSTIESIPFIHWFTDVKDKLDVNLIKTLSPYITEFYKIGNFYFGAKKNSNESIYVFIAINTGSKGEGLKGMLELVKECKQTGIKNIYFMVSSKNEKMNNLCKQYNVKVNKISKNYFAEQEDGIEYVYEVE